MALDFLDNEHPVRKARLDEWERGTTRLHGGRDVLGELWPFEWEDDPSQQGAQRLVQRDVRTKDVVQTDLGRKVGEHYTMRCNAATYLNFPDMFAHSMVGPIMREVPQVNFGTLGDVERAEGVAEPSRAEQFYYNTDGVGNDGSQFWNFVRDMMRRAAAATGHRWCLCEMPSRAPQSRADEINGLRPYWVDIDPALVWDWHYLHGKLAYFTYRPSHRDPRVENGKMVGSDEAQGYYFMVARGWKGFDGSEPGADDYADDSVPTFTGKYSDGGWWLFNADKKLLDWGTWDKTLGEIPVGVMYYERATGTKHGGPAISRSGASELGNCAVAYMVLSSAADFDAHDAAGSQITVAGADPDGFNVYVEKRKGGNKVLPLPTNTLTGQVPVVHDASTGAVAAGVFNDLLSRKVTEANQLAAMEATSVPESSGVSKEVGYQEIKAPRLSSMASEIEQFVNTMLRFTELRWGTANQAVPPSASVTMPREYKLRDVLDDMERYFTVAKTAGLKSRTADAQAMTKVALETGAITEDQQTQVQAEYEESADMAAEAAANLEALAGGGFGAGGGGGGQQQPAE